MKITKDLRLAFPIDSEERGTLLIYSIPIARDAFELYFAELGAVFKACYAGDEEGIHLALVGPQIAFSALKAASLKLKTWDKPAGVQAGFVNELIRLTSVSYVDPEGGWKTLPMAVAQERGILDDEDSLEVLNSLVFFTAASRVGPKLLVESMFPLMTESRGWEYGSWTSTDFIASWNKSNEDTTSDSLTQDPVPGNPSSIIA